VRVLQHRAVVTPRHRVSDLHALSDVGEHGQDVHWRHAGLLRDADCAKSGLTNSGLYRGFVSPLVRLPHDRHCTHRRCGADSGPWSRSADPVHHGRPLRQLSQRATLVAVVRPLERRPRVLFACQRGPSLLVMQSAQMDAPVDFVASSVVAMVFMASSGEIGITRLSHPESRRPRASTMKAGVAARGPYPLRAARGIGPWTYAGFLGPRPEFLGRNQ
jgi:hypothetical protein